MRAALGDVVLVGLRGGDVRRDDVRVAADALIDVRGHVDDVAGARHERQEAIRFSFGALGRVGGFPEMDPQVQRTGMILVQRDGGGEPGVNLARLVVRLPVAGPVVPRT